MTYGPVSPTGPRCPKCGEMVIIYPHRCNPKGW